MTIVFIGVAAALLFVTRAAASGGNFTCGTSVAEPGSTLYIQLDDATQLGDAASVTFIATATGARGKPIAAAISRKLVVQAVIPHNLRTGYYDVEVTTPTGISGRVAFPHGFLTVHMPVIPHVDAVLPSLSWREHGHNTLTFYGSFVGAAPNDTAAVIDGTPIDTCSSLHANAPCVSLFPSDDGKTVRADLSRLNSFGEKAIQLRVGDQLSNATVVDLAATTPNATRMVDIGAIVVLLALMAYFVASSALLIERGTMSYSLSRLAMCSWLCATMSVVGGRTLALSIRSKYVSVPSLQYGVILAVAFSCLAATAVHALETRRVNRAGGAATPRLTDFVAVGGATVPSRVQFLCATIGATVLFVAENLDVTARNIRLDDWIAWMSTISGLVYLIGRYLAIPGPRLFRVELSDNVLTIRGSDISTDAALSIRGVDVMRSKLDAQVHDTDRGVVLQSDSRGAARVLRYVFVPRALANLAQKGPLEIRLTNPNGQHGEARITMPVTAGVSCE